MKKSARKPKRKSSFVPRVVFATACVVSVVPMCVTSCTAGTATNDGGTQLGVANLGYDSGNQNLGVAAMGFEGGAGVANIGFDSSTGVANLGFDSGADASAKDASDSG